MSAWSRISELAGWRRLLLAFLTFVAIVFLYGGLRFLKPRKEEHKQLYILCFGDSITAGAVVTRNKSRRMHPYSLRLQLRLDELLGKVIRPKQSTKIRNAGVLGEVAQKEMERRLPQILTEAKRNFDWVIILGGTNDIKRRLWMDYSEPVHSKMIFKALRGLHLICHKHGSKSMAVTIPARQCEVRAECNEVKEMRERINTWLREFAEKSGDRVVLVDLAREMEFPKFRQYWSDELHFTDEGYDKMGDVIFSVLEPYVS